jgi:prolipoprotein diacylglyceryltransferase
VSASDIVAIITAGTALIGAVTALIVAVLHVIHHDSIPADKPVDPPAVPVAKQLTRLGNWE